MQPVVISPEDPSTSATKRIDDDDQEYSGEEVDTVHSDEDETELEIDEMIINAVKTKPPLYDIRKVPVKERTLIKKTALWLKVCQEVHVDDVEFVKKRWVSLRRKYMTKRNQMTAYRPSGSAATTAATKAAAKNNFKFYELMNFLKDSTDPVT